MRPNRKVLIVDDNTSIHDDYRKVLSEVVQDDVLDRLEAELLSRAVAPEQVGGRCFELSHATQGEEALALAAKARAAGSPFAVAFVDVRMPPGIDGVETTRRLWEIDPDLQVVICSAYSDYCWTRISAALGVADRWVILKKPFDHIEVLQLAHSLAEKWRLGQQTRGEMSRLEGMVANRTAELETALRQLRTEAAERQRAEGVRREIERKLEEAQRLESLGVLAGGVAHDFNNILTGILVAASMARRDVPPNGEVGAHLQLIEDNSRRAAALCEQLLTYAGKAPVESRALDLNTVLRETLELLQVSVPKDAELTVTTAEDVGLVRGDESRLRQVLMNLVLNAAEALRDAPRRIRVTTGQTRLDAAALARCTHPATAMPGTFSYVEVTDTGIGMSAETIRRMFEPFFTTKFTGRGLGLCAVLGIMRTHGGVLDVVSTLGQGTTFRAYFPSTAGKLESVTPAPAPMSSPLSGTILVVDDEPSVREVTASILRRKGAEVLLAQDGAEAVAVAADATELTGIVMDVNMPRMDGVVAMEAIRLRHPNVPVLLITGADGVRIKSRVAGAERITILQKPFTFDGLLGAVTELFYGR